MFWVFLTNALVQTVNFVVSVMLARILVPEDYGKVSLALIFIGAFGIFRDVGLSQALIYRREEVQVAAQVAFTMNVAIGLVLFAGIVAASPLVDALFATQGLQTVTAVLGVTVLFGAAGSVPAALLDKELEFRRKFAAEVVPVLAYAAISLPMAYRGYGLWSLVGGGVTSAAANMTMLWLASGWRPRLAWDGGIARELLGYGQHLAYTAILIFIGVNLDRILLGKLATPKEVGIYSLAFAIGNLPSTQITGVAGKVLFPTYAKLGNDPGRLAAAYVTTFRMISLVSIPSALGLMVVSRSLVEAVYGAKWLACVVPLAILSLFGLLRSVGAISGNVFLALGRSEIMPRMMLVQIAVAAISMAGLGWRFGVPGVAFGALIAILVTVVWGIALIVKWLPVGWRDILGFPLRYGVAAAGMGLCVGFLGWLVPRTLSGLAAQIASGVAVYCVAAMLLAGDRIAEDYRLVMRAVA
jgi:O-antigen/teichoic acid export membrane protein